MPRPGLIRLLVILPALAAASSAAPLKVVTLGTVLTEIAGRIGGGATEVTGLVQPGVDPHTFQPAPHDLETVANADLVLACGLGMEPYLDRLVANSGTRGRVVQVGSVFGTDVPTLWEHGRREADPHWWNSVPATEKVTREVDRVLGELRPVDRTGFDARTARFLARLAALDRWTRDKLAAIPPDRRVLVTTHDAFGWFARDYGFRIIPLSGLNPEAEPDARSFARTIDAIRAAGVPALFVENSANPRLVAAVVQATGARLGGTLYGDGLTTDADARSYREMFRHNVRVIAAGLRPGKVEP
ncbi:MAG: metal ABC transporter solute-binding protein, Zn/Mn family [Opitutaceae bacterium]